MEPGASTAGTPPQASIDAAAAAQVPDLTGRTLGDFLLLRRLGQGGMGQVYLAEQVSLKRQVALKLLRPELGSNATSLKRFKSEAENVARATHANIVQVYAIGEAEGFHFMALEYVEGRNLREHLEKKGPPDVLLGLSIIRQVAAALQRAGELGLIHRDIKPENILLTRKGEVKVADFGLSRVFAEDVQPLHLTQTGVTMGTPLYMSPEQVENRPVDPRTDIYSLGVTCYHMFAGQPPFRGNSPFEVALQHVHKEADPLGEIRPDLPADLVNLVQRMMAKKPEDRFQSAREILREAGRLRDVLVGLTSGVTLPPVASGSGPVEALERISTQTLLPYRPSPWPRRLGILLVLAAAAGGAWLSWHLRRQEPPAAPRSDDADTAKALFSRKEREKDLQRRVQELLAAKPGSRLDRDAGCKDVMDLGLLYLKEFRLDEAECFFQELDQMGREPAYRVIGKLGWGMTLAFRDRAQESNQAFLGVLERDKMDKLPLMNPLLRWKEYPPFREMMARALLHNKTNAPADFPSRLENYLHPPAPVLRKG